jgi:AraC-like DNA-binding protein
LPRGALAHGFLIPVVLRVLADLDVGASLWQEGRSPELIHESPGLQRFEAHHRAIDARHVYNDRSLERMARTRSSVLGEHGRLHDLFVPVVAGNAVVAALIAGPFLTARPTADDILERWRSLTGQTGHLHDLEFARYVSALLDTLVLEGRQLPAFVRLLELLSATMAAEGQPERLSEQVRACADELEGARLVEKTWEAARSMVDVATSRALSARYGPRQLLALGLPDTPTDLCVGLFVRRGPESDPLKELLQRHNFQRACVHLARTAKETIAGRVGEQGVVFLCGGKANAERTRQGLVELADSASRLARRRFQLMLHVGLGKPSASLPAQYRSAVEAAGRALSEGAALLVHREQGPHADALGRLRRELLTAVEQSPEQLAARFEELIEAVAARAAFQPAVARAHLDGAFEPLIGALLDRGAVETKGIGQLASELGRAADDATTVGEIFGAYRRAISELADAVQRPAQARHERGLGRAEAYVRTHLTEQLRLAQLAKLAGFEATYFSRLFHKKVGKTLAAYVLDLRLERARELLATTRLGLSRVAELSGFSSAQYLCRVHKRRTSETPDAYRSHLRALDTQKE